MSRWIYIVIGIATGLVSISPLRSQEPAAIVVFAAASLTNAMTDLVDAYSAYHTIDITVSTAGSSTLATQIEQGASADIFASANPQQMQRLADGDFIHSDEIRTFASNQLTIITPADNPANITSAADLSQPGLLLVIAQPAVPVREYTDTLLQTLAERYGDTFPDDVYANVVSEASNVRQIVARVALGEADAGIVYRTDITPDVADALQQIALPTGTSPQADYLIAPLKDSNQTAAAQQFIDFIFAEEGQAILQTWGFCPPPQDTPLNPEQTPEATPQMTHTPLPEVTPEATPAVDTACD